SDFVLEKAIAVVGYEPVDVMLIALGDAQGCLEMFPGQGEAVAAVMRRADDHEQRRRRLLKDFLETPGEAHAAAVVIDMGKKNGPQAVLRSGLAGQAGPTRIGKELAKLAAQNVGIRRIAAKAARLAHGVGQTLAEPRTFQEKGFVESFDQAAE